MPMHRRETGAPIWRYSEITPQIYVGGQHTKRKATPKCANSASPQWSTCAKPSMSDVKLGIGGERHLHLPTVDHTPPSVDDSDARRGIHQR